MLTEEKFYAKILLFGEHTLMYGSQALSIPYFERFGYFSFSADQPNSLDSVSHLQRFSEYLEAHPQLPLDTNAFKNDIKKGLVYNTNIPLGYGLGSSGSLVAAVYSRYGTDKILKESETAQDLKTLKQLFSEMESFFHGKSSGLDPLICYFQKSITINPDGELSLVTGKPFHKEDRGAVFILDSGQQGETHKMVRDFAVKCKNSDFLRRVQEELIPATNQCIKNWISGEKESFFNNIENLSSLTVNFLTPMVPNGFESIWKNGLENNDYYLKLCGSGGGGMILGFTRHWAKAKELLRDYPVHLVQKI
ncbi:MAG: mevalonate kinase [Bacteroidales bacterium]|nr:mevalonate kinase [Bacteroidales bacterium]